MQGFAPGRDLFTTYKGMTYSLLVGFLFANILMGFFGWLISKKAVKLAALPLGLLLPLIMLLSVIGSFAIRNNMFDVYVMLFFGVVGYAMRKTDIPAAPAVLALILGPMAERNLMTSFQMAKTGIIQYYLTRPLCWFFILCIVFSIVSPALSARKKQKESLQNRQKEDVK